MCKPSPKLLYASCCCCFVFFSSRDKETIGCMRARRDELSSNQNVAVTNNLKEVGGSYIPLLAAWCAQLLPEIADEEEVGGG